MSFKLNYREVDKLLQNGIFNKFSSSLVLNLRQLGMVFTFVNDRKKLKSKYNFMTHKNYIKLPLWKIVWWFFFRTKHLFILQLGNQVPCVYIKELKMYIHTKICTQIIIASLLIIAKTYKQPRSSSEGEWYTCIMEYNSALKRNKHSSHEKTWEKCKWNKPLWEATYCMVPTIWHFVKGNIMETGKRSVVVSVMNSQSTGDF